MRDDLAQWCEALNPRAERVWGKDKFYIKAVEECAELSQRLCKRAAYAPVTDQEIIDEIADVLVVATRLKFYFGSDAVNEVIAMKLQKLGAAIALAEEKLLTSQGSENVETQSEKSG